MRMVCIKPYTGSGCDLQGFARCPGCGKLFEPGHAARKPRYCEDCGARLVWGE